VAIHFVLLDCFASLAMTSFNEKILKNFPRVHEMVIFGCYSED